MPVDLRVSHVYRHPAASPLFGGQLAEVVSTLVTLLYMSRSPSFGISFVRGEVKSMAIENRCCCLEQAW